MDTLDALGMLARFGRDVAGALVIAADAGSTDDAVGLSYAAAPGLVAVKGVEVLSRSGSCPVGVGLARRAQVSQ